MTHALLFVSMGVEARCCPSKSTAHHRHMKRQPFLCNGCPRRGRRHCCRCRHLHCHRYLYCHHQLHCRCCCCCRCNRPLPLPWPSTIAIAVAVDHRCRHLCRIAVSHCCCRCPCCRTLPSPSPSAIVVAIAVGHLCRWPFLRVVALARQELYSTN
jgi:hypothetical protein